MVQHFDHKAGEAHWTVVLWGMFVTFFKYRGYICPSPVTWKPSWRSLPGISPGPLALLGSIVQTSSYTLFSVSLPQSAILYYHTCTMLAKCCHLEQSRLRCLVNTSVQFSLVKTYPAYENWRRSLVLPGVKTVSSFSLAISRKLTSISLGTSWLQSHGTAAWESVDED